ncbi:MAG: hypothetical protein V2I54_03405 [Bacteroidales bacterium]|nr:hypothetical protein [Bacteroidales bacterium]
MVSINEGLIDSKAGMISCRIMFRLYLVVLFDESSRYSKLLAWQKASIFVREAKSRGRMMAPDFSLIPESPLIPVPRARLVRKVSI